jgi:hypothetical protein
MLAVTEEGRSRAHHMSSSKDYSKAAFANLLQPLEVSYDDCGFCRWSQPPL